MTANQRAGSLWASLVGIISLQPIDEKRGSLTVAAIEMIERALTEERKAGAQEEREVIARLIEQAGLISLRDLAKCVRARSS